MYETRVDRYHFNGIGKIPAVASATHGPWAKTVTAAAGSPVVANTAGELEMTLDNTNEVQNLCVNFGDVLSYDIDAIDHIEILARCSASLDAAVQIAFGLASARNDAIDSLAAAALFRLIGSNALLVETDDGTNDNDDVATGMSVSSTLKKFVINFKEGVNTKSGVPSTGGKSAVRFKASNGQGLLRPVLSNKQFDMSNYSAGLQPYFQIQKTSGTAVGSLFVKEVCVHHRF